MKDKKKEEDESRNDGNRLCPFFKEECKQHRCVFWTRVDIEVYNDCSAIELGNDGYFYICSLNTVNGRQPGGWYHTT